MATAARLLRRRIWRGRISLPEDERRRVPELLLEAAGEGLPLVARAVDLLQGPGKIPSKSRLRQRRRWGRTGGSGESCPWCRRDPGGRSRSRPKRRRRCASQHRDLTGGARRRRDGMGRQGRRGTSSVGDLKAHGEIEVVQRAAIAWRRAPTPRPVERHRDLVLAVERHSRPPCQRAAVVHPPAYPAAVPANEPAQATSRPWPRDEERRDAENGTAETMCPRLGRLRREAAACGQIQSGGRR